MVPGFILVLPGLLLLIVLSAQLVGATIFIPITRRLLGGAQMRIARGTGAPQWTVVGGEGLEPPTSSV